MEVSGQQTISRPVCCVCVCVCVCSGQCLCAYDVYMCVRHAVCEGMDAFMYSCVCSAIQLLLLDLSPMVRCVLWRV